MLDALKNLTGGKNKLVQKQTDELEAPGCVCARRARPRSARCSTTLTTRSQKLTPLSKSLEQMTDRVTSVTERLDDIADPPHALIDDHTKALEELDTAHPGAEGRGATRREQTTQKALGPDGELQQAPGSAAPACRRRRSATQATRRDVEERARRTRRGARPAAQG